MISNDGSLNAPHSFAICVCNNKGVVLITMEKYEVISTLGRGAGGIVSLAREKNSARFGFVMKIIF